MNLKFRAWYVLAEEMIDEILMISFVRKEVVGKFSDGSTQASKIFLIRGAKSKSRPDL